MNDELEDDAPADSEERVAFLGAEERDSEDLEAQMVESLVRPQPESHY